MSNYPDDMSGRAICYVEGCLGKGACPRCGEINYRLLGYYGAVAHWAKVWDVTEAEAEERFVKHKEDGRCGVAAPG